MKHNFLKSITLSLVSSALLYACQKDANTKAPLTQETVHMNQILSVSKGEVAALTVAGTSLSQEYVLVVDQIMPAPTKVLFNGKIVKEGENRFVFSPGIYISFVITNGILEKALFMNPGYTKPVSVDLLRRPSSTSNTLWVCDMSYKLCQNDCQYSNQANRAACDDACLTNYIECQLKNQPRGIILQ